MKVHSIILGLLFFLIILSGCTTQTPKEKGNVILYISDAPANIDDFNSLVVSLNKARVFKTGLSEQFGFDEFDFESTVDLTHLVGENSIDVLEMSLGEGTYTKIELFVSEVKGILKSGDEVTVDVPSNKLKLVKPFIIEANKTVKFVFDINVAKKGQKDEYNLLPVIGKSGIVGKDIPENEFEEVECTVKKDCKKGNEYCINGNCAIKVEEPEPSPEAEPFPVPAPEPEPEIPQPEPEPTPECTGDADCGENEICQEGECVASQENATVSLTGNFVLLVSDKRADISDFDSVIVEFSKARIFKLGFDEGFEERELNGSSVDLTQVVGEKAISILNIELEVGDYTKVELHVSNVNGTINGSEVIINVPSDKLQLVRRFTIVVNESTKFVFDIDVVKLGNKDEFKLQPVIAKSGVVGVHLDEDEVEEVKCTEDADCKQGKTCTDNVCA